MVHKLEASSKGLLPLKWGICEPLFSNELETFLPENW